MMKDFKIKAVIIKKTNYSENDVIFDVLTNEGKVIGFFGRGARKVNSKFSGILQIGMFVSMTYTSGKNLNYPTEIAVEKNSLFSFYSRTIKGMNFYTDVLLILRTVAKDLEEPELYTITLDAFKKADSGEDLMTIYNDFLNGILELIGIDTELKCYFSGELISDNEFYYSPDTNRVISQEKKPNTIDLPLISSDEVFVKGYLQRLIYGNIQHKLKLRF